MKYFLIIIHILTSLGTGYLALNSDFFDEACAWGVACAMSISGSLLLIKTNIDK
jgi:hypothetical protein